MSGSDRKPCSYHTFILPFTWKIPGVKSGDAYKRLKSIFDDNCFWQNTNLENDMDIMSRSDMEDFGDITGFYKEYQYFYPYVRKSIYGFGDDICANYLLKGTRNNGEYHIIKNDDHYVLNINAIRVRLVNTGVAIFVMECENYGTDHYGMPQSSIEDIKNINDYGRRITLPYINENSNICADRLELHIPGIADYVEDYQSYINDICQGGIDSADGIALNHICEFIKGLLSYGSRYRFISRFATKKDEIRIWPALDDRMYVAYAVENKWMAENIAKTDNDKKYQYYTDDDINQSLHELAYNDNNGNNTCPDRGMRLELLDKALYKRWLPYGTFYAITPAGFGMVSSAEIGGGKDHLYETFITCYLQMVYITVIQKASIVLFNREAAGIAKHFVKRNRKPGRKDLRNIMSLLERHAAFDNQLFFSEVSSEIQAIEMYDKLKSAFKLEEENEKLENYLKDLYEITDTNLNSIVNTSVEILTWISIFLSGGALLYSVLFTSDVIVKNPEYKNTLYTVVNQDFIVWLFLLAILIFSLISVVVIEVRNRRK